MPLLFLTGLSLLSLYVYFAFFKLHPDQTITDQWEDYVNPLNQAFLFFSGFLMGLLFREVKVSNAMNLALLAGSLLLFTFYPVSGDRILLVTGFNRLLFTALCLMICFGFYKLQVHLPAILERPLTMLGEASYSVYLLHPIVYAFTGTAFGYAATHFFRFPESVRVFSSFALTLVFSYLTYVYFEKYFMRLGHQQNKRVQVS